MVSGPAFYLSANILTVHEQNILFWSHLISWTNDSWWSEFWEMLSVDALKKDCKKCFRYAKIHFVNALIIIICAYSFISITWFMHVINHMLKLRVLKPFFAQIVYLYMYYLSPYVKNRYDMSSPELLFGWGAALGSQVQPDDVPGRRILWCGLRRISSYLWGAKLIHLKNSCKPTSYIGYILARGERLLDCIWLCTQYLL